ncbi:MAG: DUF6320 domain-containing protein [Oscillospiraceae bacterium]|nr:DUF6320 domain-containing protein [Oscillospiraceae bacterium]
MKTCKACGVTVENRLENCPLCERPLKEVTPDYERDYPGVRSHRRYRILFKAVVFLSLAVGAVSLFIDYISPSQMLWSYLVVAATLYLWVSVLFALRSSHNVGLMVLVQILGLSGLSVLVDYLTGNHHWAIDYVIPGMTVLGSLVITLTILVKPMHFRDYLLYQLVIALFGLLCLLLLWFDIPIVRWGYYASGFYSAFTVLGMFLFADRKTKHELKKRFHF